MALQSILKAVLKPKTAKAKSISNKLRNTYADKEIEIIAEELEKVVEENVTLSSTGKPKLNITKSDLINEVEDNLDKYYEEFELARKDTPFEFRRDANPYQFPVKYEDIESIITLDNIRAGHGGKTDNIVEEIGQKLRSVKEPDSLLGEFAPKVGGSRQGRREQIFTGLTVAGVTIPATALTTLWFSNNEEPPTSKEASKFEKAFSKAFKEDKDTFMFENPETGEMEEYSTKLRRGKAEGSLIGGQKELDKDGDGDIDGDDFAALRENKAHGSLSILMTPEMMPVDTYPNMSPEEEKAAKKSQLPDEEMQDNYIDFVMDESLSEDEQDYLAEALEKDNKLSEIMDKVITTASEFSGAGEVDGPGTGVSDSIPARLSDGEFVFTKKATDQIGVDKLQEMMDDAEREFDEGQKKQMAFGGMLTDDPMQDEKEKDYMESLLNTEDAIKQQMIRANRTPSVYANLR